MTVVHEHRPRPMPTRVWVVILNSEGQRWQVPPTQVYSRNAVVPPFPISFLTGRGEDDRLGQARIELQFEYDG
jgi:hypothetical protein